MSKLEKLEWQIGELSPEELAAFRESCAEFDGAGWDRQIEADVAAGKLDALAERALREYKMPGAAGASVILASLGALAHPIKR